MVFEGYGKSRVMRSERSNRALRGSRHFMCPRPRSSTSWPWRRISAPTSSRGAGPSRCQPSLLHSRDVMVTGVWKPHGRILRLVLRSYARDFSPIVLHGWSTGALNTRSSPSKAGTCGFRLEHPAWSAASSIRSLFPTSRSWASISHDGSMTRCGWDRMRCWLVGEKAMGVGGTFAIFCRRLHTPGPGDSSSSTGA